MIESSQNPGLKGADLQFKEQSPKKSGHIIRPWVSYFLGGGKPSKIFMGRGSLSKYTDSRLSNPSASTNPIIIREDQNNQINKAPKPFPHSLSSTPHHSLSITKKQRKKNTPYFQPLTLEVSTRLEPLPETPKLFWKTVQPSVLPRCNYLPPSHPQKGISTKKPNFIGNTSLDSITHNKRSIILPHIRLHYTLNIHGLPLKTPPQPPSPFLCNTVK